MIAHHPDGLTLVVEAVVAVVVVALLGVIWLRERRRRIDRSRRIPKLRD